MNDDQLYLKVTEEVTNGKIDPALWAKAIAKALGDEDKGKYEYINLRVEQLKESPQNSSSQPGDERYMPPGAIVTPLPDDDTKGGGSTDTFTVEDDDTPENPSSDFATTYESSSFFKKLISGEFGLAKTYWGFAIGIGFLLYIFSFAIGSMGSPALSIIWILGLYTYQVIVWIGVWRAASLYNGPMIWAGLAKFAVILGALMAFGQLATIFNP